MSPPIDVSILNRYATLDRIGSMLSAAARMGGDPTKLEDNEVEAISERLLRENNARITRIQRDGAQPNELQDIFLQPNLDRHRYSQGEVDAILSRRRNAAPLESRIAWVSRLRENIIAALQNYQNTQKNPADCTLIPTGFNSHARIEIDWMRIAGVPSELTALVRELCIDTAQQTNPWNLSYERMQNTYRGSAALQARYPTVEAYIYYVSQTIESARNKQHNLSSFSLSSIRRTIHLGFLNYIPDFLVLSQFDRLGTYLINGQKDISYDYFANQIYARHPEVKNHFPTADHAMHAFQSYIHALKISQIAVLTGLTALVGPASNIVASFIRVFNVDKTLNVFERALSKSAWPLCFVFVASAVVYCIYSPEPFPPPPPTPTPPVTTSSQSCPVNQEWEPVPMAVFALLFPLLL